MNLLRSVVFLLGFSSIAFAGGSISWEHVKADIAKDDPALVKTLEKHFTIARSGGGMRLGPHFGERAGERIAPYDFEAVHKKDGKACSLKIEESDDYDFTKRYKFLVTWKPEAGK